jgi:hypothetical protein
MGISQNNLQMQSVVAEPRLPVKRSYRYVARHRVQEAIPG